MHDMDKAWQDVYNKNAKTLIPDYQKSCWIKSGFEERFSLTKQLIKSINDCKTIIDVGCGPGTYCNYFYEKGYKVTGVDYAKEVIKLAKKNYPKIPFKLANGNKLPFKDNSFDIVLSIGVLQCLYNYKSFIKELKRITKKHLIISTLRRGKVKDIQQNIEKQLQNDSWPTILYHPDDIREQLKGFKTNTITKHNNKFLSDCFFIHATKE